MPEASLSGFISRRDCTFIENAGEVASDPNGVVYFIL
jgi:hypothetical protein